MENDKRIRTIDSWIVTHAGILADLQHRFEGLPAGSIIQSLKNAKQWRIKSRVLFSHTVKQHKMFPVEQTTFLLLSFSSLESEFSFSRKILEQEEKGIFQYQLQPVGHDAKPEEGEYLIPITI